MPNITELTRARGERKHPARVLDEDAVQRRVGYAGALEAWNHRAEHHVDARTSILSEIV